MADIVLTCEACGATLTISEYAKPDSLVCSKCNHPLAMPEAKAGSSDRLLPERIRQAKAEAKAEEEANAKAGKVKPDIHLSDISKNIHQRKRKRTRTELIVPTLKAVALFLLLILGFFYIRYMKGYTLFLPDTPASLETIRYAGFVAVLFFHIVVVIEALTYDFLTGLFCLLIPGYSLYYLFTTSDSFWLRAIVMALVIIFGYDFAFHLQRHALDFYEGVNVWLEAGATPEPTTRLK